MNNATENQRVTWSVCFFTEEKGAKHLIGDHLINYNPNSCYNRGILKTANLHAGPWLLGVLEPDKYHIRQNDGKLLWTYQFEFKPAKIIWTDFIFLGSNITADGDCSHEIKRRLFLGRKVMTNLDSILKKNRDITLPTKVPMVKAMVFPVIMYGYESWTIKKAEHQRIDAFELWCRRILLRVPWRARRSNQFIPKEINPEYSLEGLMLKLKLQYFGHLMQRPNSLEKILIMGKIEGRR